MKGKRFIMEALRDLSRDIHEGARRVTEVMADREDTERNVCGDCAHSGHGTRCSCRATTLSRVMSAPKTYQNALFVANALNVA